MFRHAILTDIKGSLASYHVSAQDGLTLHILEAELTDVQTPQTGVFLRVRRMVPSVELITAKQDGLDHVTALCDLTLQTKFLLQTTKSLISTYN